MDGETDGIQLMSETQLLVAFEAARTFFDEETGACVICGHGTWNPPPDKEPAHQISFEGEQIWRVVCRQCMLGEMAVCWKRPGSPEFGETFEIKPPEGVKFYYPADETE